MPKVNLSITDQKNADLLHLINYKMRQHQLTRTELSRRTQIPIATLNRRLSDIGSLTVNELRDISYEIGLDITI